MEKMRFILLNLMTVMALGLLSACGENAEPLVAELAIEPTATEPIVTEPTAIESTAKPSVRLTYLKHFDIEYKAAGLREPSGLALSGSMEALWTVSDNKKRIFQLTLEGDLQPTASFDVPEKGLEGIALTPDEKFLLMVQEERNEILKIDVATRSVEDRRRLADMVGYENVAGYLSDAGSNKGLEGITWNRDSDTLFVLKEGLPGLLIEVSSDLQTILGHKLLNAENGFRDDVSAEKLDFSGMDYDAKRSLFWIVSDKGQRIFLYDWQSNRVLDSTPLAYRRADGSAREIEKAEGIAIDAENNLLYVVSDSEARLYVFDIQMN